MDRDRDMDKDQDQNQDQAARVGQDPGDSSLPGNGTTIPQSTDGVGATSTSEKSTFEPEEDLARRGGPDEGS